jgi:DNA-binding beta-propeller fold protein YncE
MLPALVWAATAMLPSTGAAFTASTSSAAQFTAYSPYPVLTQPAETASCTGNGGSGGACSTGQALSGATSVVVSADGVSVHVASMSSNALSAFSRSSATGFVTQLAGSAGCVQHSGSWGGVCASAVNMFETRDVAVTADGKNAYSVGVDSNALTVLSRTTGTSGGQLTRTGCFSQVVGTSGCSDGMALLGAYGVTLSPDDKQVYVVSRSLGSVAILSRNTTTGALAKVSCRRGVATDGDGEACTVTAMLGGATSLAVSPDGKNAYVAAGQPSGYGSGAVAVFSRDLTSGALTPLAGTSACVSETGDGGTCVDGAGLWGASDVVVSPTGTSVYVTSSAGNAVAVFSRNTTTGALTQLSGTARCISADGSGGECTVGNALSGAAAVAVTPDSTQVLVASRFSGSLSVFNRNATTGALTQAPGTAGCYSASGAAAGCTPARALAGASGVAVSPDGKDVYVASATSGAVALLTRTR